MATRMQQRRGTAAQWTGANPTLAAGEIGYETDTGKFKIGNGSSAWGALNYYVDANAILDGAPGVLDTLNELAAALGDDPAFITTVGTNLSNHTNATTSVHGIADTDDLATKDYVADAVSNAEVDQQTLAGTGIDWNSGTGQFDIDNTVVTLDGVQTLTNKTLGSATVATTQLLADSSTKIATTEFVQNRVASLINNAPSALDTLNELALALANDENFAATIATDIGDLQNNVNSRLSLSGGTLEGALTLQGDPVELLHAATKNYVDNASETAATGAVGAHSLLTTNIHGIDDVGELATKSYVGDELDTHALATDVHGISGAISTHANLSLNVHGIADTSLLATTANIETHRADTTNVHGITDTADLVLTGDARLSDTRTPTDDSVSTAKIVNSAVTADKLAGDSVTTAKIEDGAVTSAKIADGTIVNADINASAAIDWTKLAVSSTVTESDLGLITGLTGPVQTQLDALASTSSVSAHTGATTSVHGISDTSQLAYLNAANQTFTGNMEVDGNMTVDGNLTVNGTTFNASSTSIVIEDNMVQLAHQNSANTVDLGLVVAYNDGSAKHSGIVRDVSDAKWKLFKGVTSEPSTTVDFTQGSLDDLALNNLTAAGIVFTDGTQTKEGVPSRTTINSISANYNLSTGGLTLRDTMVESTAGSGITVTIPTNATTAYPVGTTIDFLQTGAGQITFAAASGVTLNGTPGLKTRTQWSSASLFKRATDTWVVLGDLSA
jgi:Major tropism determinant N-terminal domain